MNKFDYTDYVAREVPFIKEIFQHTTHPFLFGRIEQSKLIFTRLYDVEQGLTSFYCNIKFTDLRDLEAVGVIIKHFPKLKADVDIHEMDIRFSKK